MLNLGRLFLRKEGYMGIFKIMIIFFNEVKCLEVFILLFFTFIYFINIFVLI